MSCTIHLKDALEVHMNVNPIMHLKNYTFKISGQWVNSLAPGKFEWNFRYSILQVISVIDGWGISCELNFRWMSLDLTDKSTLVQGMAWCRQATSHYLSQCWPRSLSHMASLGPNGLKHPDVFSVPYRPDGSQSNLRSAAYEALMEMVKNSPKDCYTTVQKTTMVILERLQQVSQLIKH